MSTGIDLSMFVFGTVSVTKASPPTRCAWIISTAAGIRTTGASGGPFFPQPAKVATPTTARRYEALLNTTKGTKVTKSYIQFYFVSLGPFVVGRDLVVFVTRPRRSRARPRRR